MKLLQILNESAKRIRCKSLPRHSYLAIGDGIELMGVCRDVVSGSVTLKYRINTYEADHQRIEARQWKDVTILNLQNKSILKSSNLKAIIKAIHAYENEVIRQNNPNQKHNTDD